MHSLQLPTGSLPSCARQVSMPHGVARMVIQLWSRALSGVDGGSKAAVNKPLHTEPQVARFCNGKLFAAAR